MKKAAIPQISVWKQFDVLQKNIIKNYFATEITYN